MTLTSAEHCAGYGGLALAIEAVFESETRWFTEFEEAPSKILNYHWPETPNHGDMTKIDWATVEPVDIIGGGTPCQDLSHAGRRRGMTEGTRSNLWVQMRESIATIRPLWVVWENVRGAYSAEADSEMEPCAGCMGDPTDGGPVLRALGRVLGDLSDLGYDAQWRGLRAADVGAPHGRFRVFVLARRRTTNDPRSSGGNQTIEHDGSPAPTNNRAGFPDQPDRLLDGLGPIGGETLSNTDHPGNPLRTLTSGTEHPTLEPCGDPAADTLGDGLERDGAGGHEPGHRPAAGDNRPAADAIGEHRGQRRQPAPSQEEGRRTPAIHSGRSGTPTFADDAGGAWDGQESNGVGEADGPATEPGECAGTPADTSSPTIREYPGGTPQEETRTASGNGLGDRNGERHATDWGPYEAAIRRWEDRLGRRAPRPTEPTGRDRKERLSARFTEWMMGAPDGWITDPAIGISRNDQLKACGNGVVPQQAYAALMDMKLSYETMDRDLYLG